MTLLAVEISCTAWTVIRDNISDFEREASRMIVLLEQLENDIEAFFPNARTFKRPGFDTCDVV